MNMDIYLAQARVRTKVVSTRANAALARLGGESSRASLTEGLTAEEIERDTASIKKIMHVWRLIGKRSPSTITLPSGRRLIPKESATGRITQRETALGRPRHHKGKGRN